MGVHIIIGHDQGDREVDYARAVLVDSVTGVPLPIETFDDRDLVGTDGWLSAEDRAERFLRYANENPFHRPDGRGAVGDLRRLDAGELAEMRARYIRAEEGGDG